MFFGMESVAYFSKFFKFTLFKFFLKKPVLLFFPFFFATIFIRYYITEENPQIVTTLQKFAQKKKKPPPVDICAFTSIFCKKPGVKEKHPSGVHTNSSEEEISQSFWMNFILPKTHSNSRCRYVSWKDREGTAIFGL
jgi:hypothetical protein